MSDECGYDRRDNSALYNKIDTLEAKIKDNNLFQITKLIN